LVFHAGVFLFPPVSSPSFLSVSLRFPVSPPPVYGWPTSSLPPFIPHPPVSVPAVFSLRHDPPSLFPPMFFLRLATIPSGLLPLPESACSGFCLFYGNTPPLPRLQVPGTIPVPSVFFGGQTFFFPEQESPGQLPPLSFLTRLLVSSITQAFFFRFVLPGSCFLFGFLCFWAGVILIHSPPSHRSLMLTSFAKVGQGLFRPPQLYLHSFFTSTHLSHGRTPAFFAVVFFILNHCFGEGLFSFYFRGRSYFLVICSLRLCLLSHFLPVEFLPQILPSLLPPTPLVFSPKSRHVSTSLLFNLLPSGSCLTPPNPPPHRTRKDFTQPSTRSRSS